MIRVELGALPERFALILAQEVLAIYAGGLPCKVEDDELRLRWSWSTLPWRQRSLKQKLEQCLLLQLVTELFAE